MHADVEKFQEPKRNCATEDCEDAASVGDKPLEFDLELHELRVAIADGASEALLAKFWARRIVDELATDGIGSEAAYHRALDRAINAWPGFLDSYKLRRESDGKPIQWYEEPGLAKGAYATALSLRLQGGAKRPWQCFATGDSCMFQIRDDVLIAVHPLTSSAEFGTSPALIPSRPLDWDLVRSRTTSCQGTWQGEDMIFLATDALSAWILAEHEASRPPWNCLGDLGTADHPPFSDWVASRREAGRMKDDDATLVRIHLW